MATTFLVTGASRGLGLELVRQLRTRNDTVIATVRTRSSGSEAAALKAEVLEVDVADAASIERFASALKGRPIDVLINNAGVIGEDKSITALNAADFQRVYATNVFGPALLTRALLPNLRAGRAKKVINISSQLGSITGATPGFSHAYSSSKSALNMLSALAAKDLAGDGITVLPVCPGWNRTDMGGKDAPLDPRDTMGRLIALIDRLTPADSGRFLRYDGTPLPW